MKLLRALFAGLSLSASLQAGQVIFTEVMYHPAGTAPEFVEIINLSSNRLDMAKWTLSGGIDYTFPDFSAGAPSAHLLNEYERIIVSSATAAVTRTAYPSIPGSIRVYGPWTGLLDNAGDSIVLKDASRTTQCELNYGDKGKWPIAADGTGHSLVNINHDRNNDDWRNWKASRTIGGSPGQPELIESEETVTGADYAILGSTTVFNYNQVWRWKAADVDPGAAWFATAFDDSGWSAGKGILGFKPISALTQFARMPGMDSNGLSGQGGPDATEGLRTLLPRFIDGTAAPQYMVYLFRTTFDYSGPLTGVSYAIDQCVDDGVLYYLNGVRLGNAQRLVDATATVNLARTGTPLPTATQTSTSVPQTAALGIDGNNTNFTQTLNTDLAPAWTLNLNRTAAIGTVNIHNRESGNRERLRDITITIIDTNGVTVLHTSPVLNPLNSLASPADIIYDVAANNGGSPVLGRAVRISRTRDATGGTDADDAAVLSLGEVQVMGREAWNRPASAAVANPVEELSNISFLQGGVPSDPINGGLLLKAGLNVLAAEVHQSAITDTDMGFAARMRITKPQAAASVVINEVKPGSAPGQGFVEFYNSTASAVDLQGYYLTDNELNLTKYQIASSVIVPATGLATVDFAGSNLTPALPMTILLTQPDGLTPQTGFRSAILPLDGRSIGRKPEGGLLWKLFTDPTPGAANSSNSLTTTSLVLSEAHFAATGRVDWVELANLAGSAATGAGLFVASKTDWTDKVALPASVAANGFASSTVDFIPDGSGEVTLYLIDAQNNVLGTAELTHRPGFDSIQRYPVTSSEWYNSAAATQNAANNPSIHNEIVINEIMFGLPSSHDEGQFVELFNRGAAAINLSGWRFVDGISYAFPPGTTLGAGQFLVVAHNPAYITANYGPVANLHGPSGSKLRNGGELLRLEDERHNLADTVDYRVGGEWPAGTSGEGSSMELMHPDMDNSQPSSWRASDESNKSTFQTYTHTGTYKQLRGAPTVVTAYRELLLNLVSDGHIVLKNLSLTRAADPATNQIVGGDATSHGTGNGINGFLCLGTHCMSDTLADGLHLISVGSGDTKANKAEVDVIGILPNDVLTLSFQARWVAGLPLLVAQTWDRSFGKVFRFPVPNNLGTPGAANSQVIAGAAPTVDHMRHSPAVPTSTQPVVVSASVSSSVALTSVSLIERVDVLLGNGAWNTLAMNDSGADGDALAGDGIWSATVSPRANATITQFYIRATAGNGQTNECPRNAAGVAPINGQVLEVRARPGMWIVANSPASAPGTLTERYVISLFDRNSLNASVGFSSTRDWDHPLMSNFGMNSTIILNERDTLYNCELRRGGSPWTRSSGNILDRARWKPPGDNLFRNRSKTTVDNDAAGLNRFHNRMVRYMLYLSGYPVPDAEFIQQIVNSDAPRIGDNQEPPDSDFFDRAYPGGTDGELFEIDDAWYMYDTGVHNDRLSADGVTGRWFLTDWTNAAAGANPSDESPIYFHGNWPVRFPEIRYDYAALSALIKTAYNNNAGVTAAQDPAFREQMERQLDIDRAATYAAVRGYIGDWDNFTLNRGKNGYIYRRSTDGRFEFHHYDSDLGFQSTTEGFIGSAGGVGWSNYANRPWFRQRFNYYLTQLLTKYTLNSARMNAWLAAMSYQSANAHTLAPFKTHLFSYPAWFRNRETNAFNFIQASNYGRAFSITTTNNQTVANPFFLMAGEVSSRVSSVDIAGHPEAVLSWVPASTAIAGLWNLSGIALATGVNNLTVRALDSDGTVMLNSDGSVMSLPFTVTLSVEGPPVAQMTSDPASLNVAANELIVLDGTTSFDPDHGALTFAWSITPAAGAIIAHSVPGKTEARFQNPGLYTATLTVTDPALSSSTITREIVVFNANDFSPFAGGAPLGPEFTVQNMELRDNFSPSAWYSVEDNTGRLQIQILDDSAKPLDNPAFTHPLVTRDLPDTGDFSLQTDMVPATREFGNFSAGLWLETTESGVATKYAFAVVGGLNLNVYQASGAAAWSLLGGVPFTGNDATLRVVRTGATLTFQRRVAGVWSTAFTKVMPADAIAGRGGIYVATSQATTVRMSFDYILVTDSSNTTSVLASLRITEVMYNPATGGVEYIELRNTGLQPINLTGVTFEDGQPFGAYTFGNESLASGEYLCVTENVAAFRTKYGNSIRLSLTGAWTAGNLNNGGERITLRDPSGNAIHDFTYHDSTDPAWPAAADGTGPSLEVIDWNGDYNDGANWRASFESNGNPGASGLGPDSDGDGSPDSVEALFGTDPHNNNVSPKAASSTNAVNHNVTITWPSVAGVNYRVEVSPDLIAWNTLTTVTGLGTYTDTTVPATRRRYYRISASAP